MKNLINRIPKNILDIYKKIEDGKYQIFFVGGCVRNLLMERSVVDWDFTTNARPEAIQKLFKNSFYDNKFGTVGIPLEKSNLPAGRQVVEVTTYRTEGGYSDKRHPSVVKWGKTIEEDLSRRDFTINAIAFNILKNKINLVDPFKGQTDIKEKRVRAVGTPALRFKEDALRLMRAVRIATELSFEIEKNTWKEIKNNAQSVSEISTERVRMELLRIISSDRNYEGLILLKDSGILEFVIPELLDGVGISQKRPGRHHTDDVFTHNLLSMKYCSSNDKIVRFAALIHDVGKPKSMRKDKEGFVIFYNHEVIGAKIAEEICERLKFSRKDREKIISLVRWHMFSIDNTITDAAVRRFIRRIGVENVKDMIDLRIGDRLGSGTQTAESWRLKLFKERIEKELSPKPFSVEDMKVDGNDIMEILGIPSSPKVGEILTKLFEEVDEDLSKNSKEYLTKKIKEFGK
ncbi:MAG: polyA polymerase family protein, poly(A) polymerase [Microgenomates group bacterium GW2011_GWC1_38_14]|nr:MAG: tRNA adenylyl-/cytidylyl-transferase [Candidatus Levybacteria bacterium GW2011_GWA2_36_13]KKP99161.1 MAG: tRNA adenylyl-/cytidylyl-transferase [Candidatus Levybacteria bacterium GW2011_GWB1_36_18]KKQ57970.1 MAG: polyA polymerase family protein, poly(A) polymerase [Microgenomates group bacterium GW2011_GWC1_38_14]OGH43823.1 MAG: hypothetical protein A3I49_02730 [Candidatus Levybacteria bacterium RIFCSPLOWO2_02_FULL_37_11]